MSDIKKALVEVVKTERKRQNMTQVQLAAKANVSKWVVIGLEQDRGRTVDDAIHLLSALGVNVTMILTPVGALQVDARFSVVDAVSGRGRL